MDGPYSSAASARASRRQNALAASGHCRNCAKKREPERADKTLCKHCAKKYLKQGAARYRRLKSKRRCTACKKPSRPGRIFCEGCAGKNYGSRRASYERARQEMFDHYGRECRCCGESTPEFLTVDHVGGGGSAHRKRESGAAAICGWLRKRGYPKGFQILCWNCNYAQRYGKPCPHKVRR